jgi:serine phosphatase RsbU (regulator of sigma subunit)
MPTGGASRAVLRAEINMMNRRRSHLEMLACALLVAGLAVQPAVGDGSRKDKRTPAAAATAKRAKQANGPAGTKVRARAGRARTRLRAAQDPAPPPPAPAAPDPTPPPVDPGPVGDPAETVDPVAGALPEEGDAGTAPAMPSASAEAPAAAATPPAEADSSAARAPGPPPDAADGDTAETARALPHAAESPQRGDLAVAPPPVSATPPQPHAQEPGSSVVPVPDEQSTNSVQLSDPAGRPNADNRPLRTPPQASPAESASPLTQTGPEIPSSAIQSPLATPATESITRVRPGGPSQTSKPPPHGGDTVPPLQGVAGSGASDSTIGAVLVSWAKYALAVLVLLVLALGVNAILAAARTRRLERQRERLVEDIGLLQAALLPAVPARLGGLLTSVAYRPADGPAAGGDFYDAFALPDGRVGLLLGDVSGHGRQALAKTTLVRFTVRAHLEAGLSPREAIAIAGRSLDGRLADDFATVIAAIHDPAKGTLTYASAGHPPPIVVGPSRHRPVTVSSAPPIGVGFPTGQRQTVLPMPEGASVMIYSDGLLEARVDGIPVGPERLAAWLEELGPEATAKALLDHVVSHADRVSDDLAAVLLHAAPGASAPGARIEQLKLDVLDMDGPDLDGFLRAAGASEVDRLVAGRRVSELLATTSGVIVDVRTGEHPTVTVAPIGDDSGISTRPRARTR